MAKLKFGSFDVKAEMSEVAPVITKEENPDVIKRCRDMIYHSEITLMIKINNLHSQNRRQENINKLLIGLLVLTIFLHLL